MLTVSLARTDTDQKRLCIILICLNLDNKISVKKKQHRQKKRIRNTFSMSLILVLLLSRKFQGSLKVLHVYTTVLCHLLLKLNNEELLLFVYEKRWVFLISGKYYIYSHILHSFDTKLLKKRIIHKSIFLTTIFSY